MYTLAYMSKNQAICGVNGALVLGPRFDFAWIQFLTTRLFTQAETGPFSLASV